MNPAVLFNCLRGLWKLTYSQDPEAIKGRAELEQGYKETIHDPFMAGWNDEVPPKQPRQWRISKEGAITLLVMGGLICLLSWLSTR